MEPPSCCRSASELAEILRTQHLVRTIVAPLLHGRSDEVDGLIDEGLARLGSHLGVDRVYVFWWNDDGTTSNTHEWCAPGVSPQIEELQDVAQASVHAWAGPLEQGEAIVVPDVDALPDDRRDEREMLQAQDIASLLVVPMLSLGELIGFVGFDAVGQTRSFTDHEANILRSVADGIGAVLAQRYVRGEARVADARLAALTQHSTDFVLEVGTDEQTITWASPSWSRLDLPADALVGTSWAERVHPDDIAAIDAAAHAPDALPGVVVQLPDFRARSGSGRWVWLSGQLVDLTHEPAIRASIVNAHDVTERRELHARLEQQARQDPLTGLANRIRFDEHLDRACAAAVGSMTPHSVLFLDLDRFKLVNDTHGHATGDEILVRIGDRLASCMSASDLLARFGGDEFVILTPATPAAAAGLARRILEVLRIPVVVDGLPFRVTGSIGIAGVDAGSGPERVLADADTAMFEAKGRGRNRYATFDTDLRAAVVRTSAIIHRLPTALEARSLHVLYQPEVDLRTGATVGAEALVRWDDPELGAIPPAEFIALAEESGLMRSLTAFVFERVAQDTSDWPRGVRVAVNLSAVELGLPDAAENLVTRLDVAGLDPERLCVEVTETAVMRNSDTAIAALELLRALGVEIALDDFGTGQSSLAMLTDLPVDVVKIDRRFVQGIGSRPRDQLLVHAIVRLARGLGMRTVAEGIEDESEHAALLDAGCRIGQGFLFARPDTPDRISFAGAGSPSDAEAVPTTRR